MNTRQFVRYFFGILFLLCAVFLAGPRVVAGLAGAAGPLSNPVYLPAISKPFPDVIPPDATVCKLPEVADEGGVGLGFPRYPSRLTSTGPVRAKVIFVDFSDAPAAQTPEEVFAIISPGSEAYYDAVSYGAMDLQLEPYFTWLRMSKPSTDYGWSGLTYELHREYIQEAVTLADPNVDFTGVEQIYVMAPPDATALPFGPTFTGAPQWGGITADGVTIYNAVTSGADLDNWGALWLNHETGHSMGLVDLYAYSGDTHRFVGGFSLMGLISGDAPEFMAYERWLLGWLEDTQIYCQQTPDETVFISAIETPDGIKALMVPTGPNSLVAVESRRALGYDEGLTETGVLVYVVDTSIASGNGAIQVYPDNGGLKYDSPLAAGEQITVGNVTIEVIQAPSNGDLIRVTVSE